MFSTTNLGFDNTPIRHPKIASQKKTCSACPEQHEGTLTDGKTFYFRYRSGMATLGVGDNIAEAVYNSDEVGVMIGRGPDGFFESAALRDETFTLLLMDWERYSENDD